MELSFNDRRVLGVLVEKAFTAPDQYPLTLNYLINACNQKSCRIPVSQLQDADVLDALDSLRRAGLCVLVQTAGGRTDRWRQRIRDALEIDAAESAILAELLLRGPQTDGDLRQNGKRMVALDSLDASNDALTRLMTRDPPLVVRLGPEGRRRGIRFAHTLYAPEELERLRAAELENVQERPAGARSSSPSARGGSSEDRLGKLEASVEALSRRLEDIERQLAVAETETESGLTSSGSDP